MQKKCLSFSQCLQPTDSFYCVIPREACVTASIPGTLHYQGLVSSAGVTGEGALCCGQPWSDAVAATVFRRTMGRTRVVAGSAARCKSQLAVSSLSVGSRRCKKLVLGTCPLSAQRTPLSKSKFCPVLHLGSAFPATQTRSHQYVGSHCPHAVFWLQGTKRLKINILPESSNL